ncbi:multidrug efflux SMR transporter [Campylobacter sp. VicNov18]|uniref:DMT family transporter n=1 Tax=Campylobacter bilis TaxID=2691918 RepID=UPI00130D8DDB|nr:multidrug efflux SMR transporter [Campylobacter bilis]MPV63196.1 QacE family quaternary ammonium compound efflux SMR transporter [Campylobacter hepaticus]MBM0636696.1 QacE family quaternary ammonium compound efflux SMR transporter [Campylobacter bilis]MCC8277540.1 multidrug efflux SMR transporter [Campylobacter bilis]MCC8298745.1 multidrug efflux SMR transporter [Campylobacter bilis]MCC8300449.1 multidrug efflux SMR transporter [Campylobacter bilis]
MYIIFIILSAFLDIVANLLLKKSHGFKYKIWGVAAIIHAILAFFLLSFSLKYAPLSIAYSTWGAIGILGTCLGGWILYKEKLNKIGILGIVITIIAVFLLHY